MGSSQPTSYSTREPGGTIYPTARQDRSTAMSPFSKATSQMDSRKASASITGTQPITIEACSVKTKSKASASLRRRSTPTMATSKTTRRQGRANTSIAKISLPFKVHLKRMSPRAMGSCFTKMEPYSKGISADLVKEEEY